MVEIAAALKNQNQIIANHGRDLWKDAFSEILSRDGLAGIIELGNRRLVLAEQIKLNCRPLIQAIYRLNRQPTATSDSNAGWIELPSTFELPGDLNAPKNPNHTLVKPQTLTNPTPNFFLPLENPNEDEAYDEERTAHDNHQDNPIVQYIKEMSQSRLLTAEEEVTLAKQIEAAVDAQTRLAAEVIDPEEQQQLQEVIGMGEAARQTMIEANLRLVVSVARKYIHRGLLLQDLIQEGNIGLIRGVEKYDWRKSYRFSTYAYWWIRQAITRAIADQARTIRIPVHMVETINRFNRTQRRMMQELGREPTPEEVAAVLEIDPSKAREIVKVSQEPTSLETPVGDEEESELIDLVPDQSADNPEDQTEENLLSDMLDSTLRRHLTDREAEVLRMRFGLEDGSVKSLGEVGKALDISRERVRQIEIKAIRKLRTAAPFMIQFRDYVSYAPSDINPLAKHKRLPVGRAPNRPKP